MNSPLPMQICHFPRILLNFYEMMVIEEAMACSAAGKRAFAVWAQVRAVDIP